MIIYKLIINYEEDSIMNILVVNGSPKGEYSITLQTSKYLEIRFPLHKFDYLNIGATANRFEKDFSQAAEKLQCADIIIFSYPVYTFIAPSQLHKFISLMKSNNVDVAGKYATQITTSKHFYDITAHRYVEDNCYDMGLRYIRGLSADMDDLTKEKGQEEAESFFKYLIWSVENKLAESPKEKIQYKEPEAATEVLPSDENKTGDVVIVTDALECDVSLDLMIKRFSAVFRKNTRVLNLNDIKIKGGCLGCFNCAVSGECVYKDGFSEVLRNNIQKSDAIVYAFSIKDHSMGHLFKMYDDRQFCNGHRSVTMGMPIGYLVSGQLSKEENLRMILEGRSEVGGNFLAGIATDETDTDNSIDEMAKKLEYAIDNKLNVPANFLGVGGMKIFRDLVYQMRGMMKADHKFYKEHGLYDFPQKHKAMSYAMYLVGAMLSSDKIKAKMGNKMNEGMLMPYQNILKKASEKGKK